MKYYLPIHLDGGNRGCEAITKATSLILNKDKLIAYSRNLVLDRKLGLDKYVDLIQDKEENMLFKAKRKIACMFGNYYQPMTFKYHYHRFVESMEKDSVMLSTGGDMMCYNNNQVIYTNELAKSRGIKTVLWGCSIGEENLTSEKVNTLLHFDYIYTRESLTANLMEEIGCKNIGLFPDPAFILEPQECQLPACFSNGKKVIGLNVSNYVVGADNLSTTQFGNALKNTIDYLITETDYNILLVPHVLWQVQDDRIISRVILGEYESTGRLSVLDSGSLNYLQIRYVISKCHLFCGGRTHSVISAYSTCVPAIALGYSVKSQGIAKDLKLPMETVVDSKHITGKNELLNAIKYGLDKHDVLREHLLKIMPTYKEQVYGVKEIMKNL